MRCGVFHIENLDNPDRRQANFALEESCSLARALDLEIATSEVVRLRKIRPGLLFGDGKLAEFAEAIATYSIELLIIDGAVSPIQQRNLERHLKVKILDRTALILEIFGARAQTREGVLQVELAALSYQKTRLVRSWTHLERQRGGLSFVGGAGETQIEADKRAINDAILRLKRQLAKVVKTRKLHRGARQKIPFPVVALVGYTNAGKSTLFNTMTNSDVFAKDMLFATLDPTLRKIQLSSKQEVILSDTVGFISNLPTSLIAAFKATLEEVVSANVIVHVRDISSPTTEEQSRDVMNILQDLGIETATQENLIEVWNKMDLLSQAEALRIKNEARRRKNVICTNAMKGEGEAALKAAIERLLKPVAIENRVQISYADGEMRSWLHREAIVKSEQPEKASLIMTVEWSAKTANRFRKKFSEDAILG